MRSEEFPRCFNTKLLHVWVLRGNMPCSDAARLSRMQLATAWESLPGRPLHVRCTATVTQGNRKPANVMQGHEKDWITLLLSISHGSYSPIWTENMLWVSRRTQLPRFASSTSLAQCEALAGHCRLHVQYVYIHWVTSRVKPCAGSNCGHWEKYMPIPHKISKDMRTSKRTLSMNFVSFRFEYLAYGLVRTLLSACY